MMEVMEDREVWRLNLELLPLQPSQKAGNEERRSLNFKTIQMCIVSQQFWHILLRHKLLILWFCGADVSEF